MATNYPGSLDTTTQLPDISATDEMDDSNKEHDVLHTNENQSIIQLESKVGISASTPTSGAVFMGTGTGTSAWDTTPTFSGATITGSSYAGSLEPSTVTASTVTVATDDLVLITDTSDSAATKKVTAQSIADLGGGGGGGLPTGMTFSNTDGLRIAPTDVGSNGAWGYGSLVLQSQSSLGNTSGTNVLYVGANGTTNLGIVGYDGSKTFRINNMQNGWMYIGTGGSAIALGDLAFVYSGRLQPQTNNTKDIGTSSLLFQDMYSVGGVTTSSDVNLKEEISSEDALGLSFINSLRPVSYKWKDGTRTHQGFIAQEVRAALDATDSSASDQGMWGLNTVKDPKTTLVHWDKNDPNADPTEEEIDTVPKQSLRYHELIAPLVKAVQELSNRLDAIEA